MKFDINQPFVTQEQKFKYWEESKEHIKYLENKITDMEEEVFELRQELAKWS